MCLYPKLIHNRKYIPNKKNGGVVPECTDKRVKLVPVGCGKCMECIKQKGRQWSIRLQEEIRENKKGLFVTLTFSNESYAALAQEIKGLEGYELDNEIATLAVRRFLERWRKKHGTSIKHWLTTELGHNGTENVHLHGIIFAGNTQQARLDVINTWNYGFTFIGSYVSERTINYVIKYSTKIDLQHSQYKPKILCSPGIGAAYTNRLDAQLNKYKKKGETRETYTTRQGTKINLPIYYRNKIYSEQEREALWINKLDKEERWVNGTKVSTKDGGTAYYNLLKYARQKNQRLGYGNDEVDWKKRDYENQRRKLMIAKRLQTTAGTIYDPDTGEILDDEV